MNLNQVIISGGGEPSEIRGLALWDKQYFSKKGWATNILKFQKKTRVRHHTEARKNRINQEIKKKRL